MKTISALTARCKIATSDIPQPARFVVPKSKGDNPLINPRISLAATDHWPNICGHDASHFALRKSCRQSQLLSMFPSSLLVPSATVILSIMPSITIACEQAGISHHALRQGRSLNGLDSSPSTWLKPRAILPPYLMGPDWLVDHHDFNCILPIGTAAAAMENFYEDLAAYAATTSAPASSAYQLWIGQIMLEVIAAPAVTLDWIIVQQFVLEMLRLTKLGYTNTYQINYIHRPTGRMVTFSLYTGLLRAVTESIPLSYPDLVTRPGSIPKAKPPSFMERL